MNIHYSIADPYPSYRSDIAELFAVELRRHGINTSWYMKAGGKRVGVERLPYDGQEVHMPCDLRNPLLNRLTYIFYDVFIIFRSLLRGADAVQCRDKYIASVFALIFARLFGRKFFYWCSYPFPEQDLLLSGQRSGFGSILTRLRGGVRFDLLYRFICRFADHVFVQSPAMLEDMVRYGIGRDRMTPIPMGAPERIEDWVRTNKVEVSKGRLVYLGSLAEIRHLDMLVDAFNLVLRSVPHAELIFVGDSDTPQDRINLETYVARLGLTDKVKFTGFVEMPVAWSWAASASVCLSPIYPNQVLRVASPTKLVEYLALGRPVVCNQHPEQSQIIAECPAGLCVPWGAEPFAEAIAELLGDPDLAEKNAACGPSWVSSKRSYPIIASSLAQVYGRLISENN